MKPKGPTISPLSSWVRGSERGTDARSMVGSCSRMRSPRMWCLRIGPLRSRTVVGSGGVSRASGGAGHGWWARRIRGGQIPGGGGRSEHRCSQSCRMRLARCRRSACYPVTDGEPDTGFPSGWAAVLEANRVTQGLSGLAVTPGRWTTPRLEFDHDELRRSGGAPRCPGSCRWRRCHGSLDGPGSDLGGLRPPVP